MTEPPADKHEDLTDKELGMTRNTTEQTCSKCQRRITEWPKWSERIRSSRIPADTRVYYCDDCLTPPPPGQRRCSECHRNATEYDYYYGEVPPGSEQYGRVYVCRECLGEEAWERLRDVPNLGGGLFGGRSERSRRTSRS
jgi:hypothetical protein